MPAAPLSADESVRLAALWSCGVMDTPREAVFDDLTRQAAAAIGAPMAFLSLVDDRRQWFKSRVGATLQETPRDHAFCAYALLRPSEPLIVPGEPYVRFYVGVPLRSPEGHALGTLCVLDTVPRRISSAQLDKIGALAQQAAFELALRRRAPAERRFGVGLRPAAGVVSGHHRDRFVGRPPFFVG